MSNTWEVNEDPGSTWEFLREVLGVYWSSRWYMGVRRSSYAFKEIHGSSRGDMGVYTREFIGVYIGILCGEERVDRNALCFVIYKSTSVHENSDHIGVQESLREYIEVQGVHGSLKQFMEIQGSSWK